MCLCVCGWGEGGTGWWQIFPWTKWYKVSFWSATLRDMLCGTWCLPRDLLTRGFPAFCGNTCDSFIHSQSKLPLGSFLKAGIGLGERDTGMSGSYNDLPSLLGVVVLYIIFWRKEARKDPTRKQAPGC